MITRAIGLNKIDLRNPLVSQLREVERLDGELVSIAERYNEAIKKYEEHFDVDELSIDTRSLPTIDVASAQKQLIEDTSSGQDRNYILADAISEIKSVEEALYDLSKVNAGFGKIMPRFKDEEHNKRVGELSDLIAINYSMDNTLRKEGLLDISRPFTYPAAYSVAFGSLGCLAGLAGDNQNLPLLISGAAISGLLLGGLMATALVRNNKDLPWENARYLDQKIDELF